MTRLLLSVVLGISVAWPSLAQGPGPTPVVVAPVVERDLPPSLRLVGTVRPQRAATVAAEVSGVIVAFESDEGRFLRKGEVICRLDAEPFQLRLDQARGELASLKAQLAEQEHGEREEDLRRLAAQVAVSDAMCQKWSFEKERILRLRETGQSTEKEQHDTEMEFLAAERRLTQAKAEYEKATNGARPEVLARWRQQVVAKEAAVKLLEREVRKASIAAPFDGFLVAKRTEVGEWIIEGGAVADMVDVETVRVRVDVPESVIAFARPGERASVEIEALLGQPASARPSRPATIARVVPRASASARTFPVEIDLPNADHVLLPGMFVWAHVPGGPVGMRTLVSKDAIVSQGPMKQVFVVQPAEAGPAMAVPVPVITGMELEGEIEVRADGVKPGMMVVTRANERLYGPTPVLPMPASGGPPGAAPSNTAPPSAPPASQPEAESTAANPRSD
ncbi:Cobalt-zinc-cadmium resistance protein CzcB [Phycisphaerae bacterium RAS1]|nr:Cobalt-zinc-cadmium resistance protein CzcB [Phycisphaerae bacterium RAS1]